MKPGKITIKNYRSIPFDNPISLEINKGITFILGVNNVGKSNLLRFIYEFSYLKSYHGHHQSTNFQIVFPDNIIISQILNQKNYQKNLELILEIERIKYNFTFSPPNNNYLAGALNGTLLKSESPHELFH